MKTKRLLETLLGTIGTGAAGGLNASLAFNKISTYVETRSAVFAQTLAENPELMQEAYDTASEIANDLAGGDLIIGTLGAVSAGGFFSASLYIASTTKRKSIF